MKIPIALAFVLLTGAAMSAERKYSLSEIDHMRWDVYILAAPKGTTPEAISDPATFNARIEGQLRTYLQEGITPEELDDKIVARGLLTREQIESNAHAD